MMMVNAALLSATCEHLILQLILSRHDETTIVSAIMTDPSLLQVSRQESRQVQRRHAATMANAMTGSHHDDNPHSKSCHQE